MNHPRLDLEAVRGELEKACRRALHDYRIFPAEETYHRAFGRLDGILQGVGALARALEDEETAAALVALGQEVTALFGSQLTGESPPR